ncbi:integrase core domain-containing protein [Streptomyces pratens]|uniref:Integrase core domain-containing protein n=1 Tax=Streptomyces pratens TaxID=887456 RepID=A0ABW1M2R5_9ACTN
MSYTVMPGGPYAPMWEPAAAVSVATSKETRLALDAIEMTLWRRNRDKLPYRKGKLRRHSDAGSQYISFALGLFKTELIKPRRPWKTLSEVEPATAEWGNWYCHRRPHGEIGHIPPAEYETNYYRATTKPQVTVTT